MTAVPVPETDPSSQRTVGRYVLYSAIARGGMATVHLARLVGAEGFSRIVAAKCLHQHLTENSEFVTMFLDEARIASKIQHPNVVPVLDVVFSDGEIVIVQDYVHGLPLDQMLRDVRTRSLEIPVKIAVAVIAGMLAGLHSAHETKDELGNPLAIVHRDVSPQNVMVTFEGVPRLLDFGIAKAQSSMAVTRDGFFKGKVTYMSPEQVRAENVDRRADLYAAGIILWEILTGKRIYAGKTETETFTAVLAKKAPTIVEATAEDDSISPERRALLEALAPIVAKSLARNAEDRYATADEMMNALIAAVTPATPSEVAAWVKELGAETLDKRQKLIAQHEESWRNLRSIGGPSALAAESSVSGMRAKAPLSGAPMREPTPSAQRAAPGFDAPPTNANAGRAVTLALVSLIVVAGVIGAYFATKRAATANPTMALAAPMVSTIYVTASAPAAAPPAAPTDSAATTPSATPDPTPKRGGGRGLGRPRGAATPSDADAGPAPKADCNPPFYMDGTKKVFKPNCL